MSLQDIMRSIFGDKDKFSRRSRLPPGSQGIEQNPLYQSGNSYLQKILSGDPSAFADFERPMMENFNQQVVPGIAERFAGMGTGAGAGNSSALTNSLAQAGRGLSGDIGALRSGLQMQAAGQGLQYAQQPVSNDLQNYENFYQPGSNGIMGGVGQGIGAGIGMAGGAGMSQLMKMLMQMFGGGK